LVSAPEEPGNAKALPETGTAIASVKIESSKVATPEEPEECKHSRKTGIAGHRKKKRQQQKWQCNHLTCYFDACKMMKLLSS